MRAATRALRAFLGIFTPRFSILVFIVCLAAYPDDTHSIANHPFAYKRKMRIGGSPIFPVDGAPPTLLGTPTPTLLGTPTPTLLGTPAPTLLGTPAPTLLGTPA